MTILIISVLGPFFKNDHRECQYYDFEITNKCLNGNNIEVKIENVGNSKINFKSDNENSRTYELMSEKSSVMEFRARDKSKVSIIPFFEDLKGKKFECEGKAEKVDVGRLIKC
mgnify:CR=1 FL=1